MVSQSPPAGTPALPNTPVYLTASLGPAYAQPTITVPDVIGLSYLAAQNILSISGFNAVNPIWQNSNVVNDTIVISQSIAPGTPSSQQIPIYLTVSIGPVVNPYSGVAITVPTVTP